MSDNPLVLLQQAGGGAVAQALLPAMQQMASSEMQANVGASYAVVTIKGKVFSIKYGGNTTPITINMNGQTYAAPFFDVVIPKAKAELSKTYYPNGYTDGSDDAPTCWSEDGLTPLAPEPQRPIDPRTGTHCTDCRMCPMNEFGSKISETGSKGKACADTRKLILLPVAPTGQKNPDGSDVTALDGDNIKFGGPMLMRVPAASLRVFSEYDQKLQQMGVPYFGVVTRMEFDQSQAYPKFVLKATRYLTEAEALKVVEVRDSMQVKQILESGQTGAAPRAASQAALPGPDLSALAGTQVPQHLQVPVQAAPQPTAVPVQTPVTSTVVPLHPTPPAPVPVPQQAPAAPRMTAKAGGVSYEAFKANHWSDEDLVREGYMEGAAAAPPAPSVPMPPPAPVQAAPLQQMPLQMPPAVIPPTGPAPTTPGPQVTPALMNTVDSLLAS